ncbi:S-layer protein [Thermococcus henrietii]|uniref:S-layer protein n=1 Tax=Thermococcus henrietii TaxID=2016361 RepID=UPI000C087FFD|nr:S-layer protein [Thermococcus henrietii]
MVGEMGHKRASMLLGLLLMLVVTLGTTAGAPFNSANTIIVLPTTKVVNKVPLHINEDAIAGARLGAFLVLKGISEKTYTKSVVVPVEYHSVVIPDENQYYILTSRDMPDLGLPLTKNLSNGGIVLAVNFSRIAYNPNSGTAELGDGSISVTFNQSLVPLGSNQYNVLVYTKLDNVNTLYIYRLVNVTQNSSDIGTSLYLGSIWLYFHDMNEQTNEMLVDVHYPDGVFLEVMDEGKYYLICHEAGEDVFKSYDSFPKEEVETLLQSGVQEVVVINPLEFFTGISGSKAVIYRYWYYHLKETHRSGDVYSGQWVWHINSEEKTYSIYLHVNASNPKFPEVYLQPGTSINIPIPGWNLKFTAVYKKDDNGNVVGIEGYRFIRTTYVTRTVSVTAPTVTATNDVNSLIVNDTYILDNGLPKDKNVIIIGGWVSNRAWEVLEKVYGADKVNELKNELMSKGYIVAKLKNPYNPNYYVVILAGKTYRETAKAVEEFMGSLG